MFLWCSLCSASSLFNSLVQGSLLLNSEVRGRLRLASSPFDTAISGEHDPIPHFWLTAWRTTSSPRRECDIRRRHQLNKLRLDTIINISSDIAKPLQHGIGNLGRSQRGSCPRWAPPMTVPLCERYHWLYGFSGTAYVLDEVNSSTESIQTDSRLKYDRSGPVPIILVPQPSDDPNDPLVSYDMAIFTVSELTTLNDEGITGFWLTKHLELASMEARSNSWNSINRFCFMRYGEPSSSRWHFCAGIQLPY